MKLPSNPTHIIKQSYPCISEGREDQTKKYARPHEWIFKKNVFILSLYL